MEVEAVVACCDRLCLHGTKYFIVGGFIATFFFTFMSLNIICISMLFYGGSNMGGYENTFEKWQDALNESVNVDGK